MTCRIKLIYVRKREFCADFVYILYRKTFKSVFSGKIYVKRSCSKKNDRAACRNRFKSSKTVMSYDNIVIKKLLAQIVHRFYKSDFV